MRQKLIGWLVTAVGGLVAHAPVAAASAGEAFAGASTAFVLAIMIVSALAGMAIGRLALMRRSKAEDAPARDEPQVRSRDEVIAELSHAVRTPLNSVIGFSEIMHGEMFGPLGNQKYRDYADHIQADAKILLARVDDLIRTAETSGHRAA